MWRGEGPHNEERYPRWFKAFPTVAERKLAQLNAAVTLEFLPSPPGNPLEKLTRDPPRDYPGYCIAPSTLFWRRCPFLAQPTSGVRFEAGHANPGGAYPTGSPAAQRRLINRIPQRSDIYWIDLNPIAGWELKDRHRFVMITP